MRTLQGKKPSQSHQTSLFCIYQINFYFELHSTISVENCYFLEFLHAQAFCCCSRFSASPKPGFWSAVFIDHLENPVIFVRMSFFRQLSVTSNLGFAYGNISEVPGIPASQGSGQPILLESRLMLAFLSERNIQVSFLDKTFRLQTLLQSNRTFAKTAGNLSPLVFLLNHFTHTHSLHLCSNFTSP